jgi:hypothetical protein
VVFLPKSVLQEEGRVPADNACVPRPNPRFLTSGMDEWQLLGRGASRLECAESLELDLLFMPEPTSPQKSKDCACTTRVFSYCSKCVCALCVGFLFVQRHVQPDAAQPSTREGLSS